MKNVEWKDGGLTVSPPKKPKKITGTHLPEVLGVHPYATAFEAWCRCTRTYEKLFEGNEYTRAGEIVEPKVFDFLQRTIGEKRMVVRPSDVYGDDVFHKTYGDFFREREIFGGSWDALIANRATHEIEAVVEVKTVLCDGHSGGFFKRWAGGHAPDYQGLQASLYAWLLGVDKVVMVGVEMMRGRGDYDDPDKVTPDYGNQNVHLDEFTVSQRYPQFAEYIDYATRWWNSYVLTGESPKYDDKRDAEILKALRSEYIDPDSDIEDILKEAAMLKDEIVRVEELISDKKTRLEKLTKMIKAHIEKSLDENTDSVTMKHSGYAFTCSKTEREDVDKDALKRDGLYDRYRVMKTSARMIMNKEDMENA